MSFSNAVVPPPPQRCVGPPIFSFSFLVFLFFFWLAFFFLTTFLSWYRISFSQAFAVLQVGGAFGFLRSFMISLLFLRGSFVRLPSSSKDLSFLAFSRIRRDSSPRKTRLLRTPFPQFLSRLNESLFPPFRLVSLFFIGIRREGNFSLVRPFPLKSLEDFSLFPVQFLLHLYLLERL